jgi:acetolactate synthase-1/2/3 large subunit
MRIADAIFERLKAETSCVFMVPGGGAMYLVDALGRSGLRYVSTIHEQGAGYAALGYAMATDRLGVCLVTSGPGSTNILTACAAAWMDSLPVLFLSGQAKVETLVGDTGLRTRGVQEVDIIPMVKPVTKTAMQVNKNEDTISFLEYMIGMCKAGRRGPCWLSIPMDLQGMEL